MAIKSNLGALIMVIIVILVSSVIVYHDYNLIKSSSSDFTKYMEGISEKERTPKLHDHLLSYADTMQIIAFLSKKLITCDYNFYNGCIKGD